MFTNTYFFNTNMFFPTFIASMDNTLQ